jgi:hypothetical protein
MANEQEIREILSLQSEIDSVASDMSGLMTNDSSLFSTKKCATYFDGEDSNNSEIEKHLQALRQELLAGSSASDKSLLYLMNVSSTAISAAYRGHLGRKAFGNRHAVWLQERREAATIKLQRWMCMVSGMRLARIRRREIEMEWKGAAATQIQRIVRGRYESQAVRNVQSSLRNADFQFHLTRGDAFAALSQQPPKAQPRNASRTSTCSDASTSTSEDDADDAAVGSARWLPGGVRLNVHDETFRQP